MLLVAIILSDCTSLLMGAPPARGVKLWYSHRSNEINAAQRLRSIIVASLKLGVTVLFDT
jgi:hypothetical protein